MNKTVMMNTTAGPLPVEVELIGESGLGVHPALMGDGTFHPTTCVIMHTASGARIDAFESREQARRVAEFLATKTNWNQHYTEFAGRKHEIMGWIDDAISLCSEGGKA